MKLRVRRATKNKVVTLELETIDFTEKENSMLDQLGEPIIDVDQTYGNNAVKFSKKIRTGFKVKIRFDANLENNTEMTAQYIEQFIEYIQEELAVAMSKLSDEYNDELVPKDQTFEINY